jgi:hypothetical protein
VKQFRNGRIITFQLDVELAERVQAFVERHRTVGPLYSATRSSALRRLIEVGLAAEQDPPVSPHPLTGV